MGRLFEKTDSNSIESRFLSDLLNSIEMSERAYKPSKTYKPSSLKCIREMFFIMKGVDFDQKPNDYTLIGICQNGSDRHKHLQEAIMNMKNCEYVDVETYIKEKNLTDLEVRKKFGYEYLIYNKKLNMSLMVDGIIKYNNEYLLLEIKTEGAKKFYDRDDVNKDHINQAICYSICFGLNRVLFLYENRDMLDKKTFIFNVTPALKRKVLGMIESCNKHLEEDKVPKKPLEAGATFCQYCNYKKHCKGVK